MHAALAKGKGCKPSRLSTEIMLMLYASTVTIQCLLLAVVTIPPTAADGDALCEANSQVCNVDDLAVEERGSSLLQVDLRLRSDREVADLPMGPLALVSEAAVARGADPVRTQQAAGAQRRHVERAQESGAAFDSISLMQNNDTVISRRGAARESEAAFDIASLTQNNNTRISRQINDTNISRRLHLLDIGQKTQASAIVWILMGGVVLACLLMFLIMATDESSPPAEKAVVKTGMHKYERLSPQPVARGSPALGSPIRADVRTGSSIMMSPSLPPTATVPTQSRTMSENSAEEAVIAPPPICPSLILPHTEARFMVPMEQMKVVGPGVLDINGTSGRKLLHATVSDTGDGRRCLSVASCGCEDDPRVTVFTPERQSFARTPLTGSSSQPLSSLEIYGKAGLFYGTLSPAAGGGMILKHENGNVVLAVQATGDEDFRMTASSYSGGQLLASAGRNVMAGSRRTKAEVGDSWKLQVKPGVDAVLIVSCMLGTLLLAMPAASSSSRSPKMTNL
mmetsp:Transcript_151932/g.290782  ORF Transcript_151932/g.290782 Transcript_151932/m.290782 type:complete len:511 (+) Transcript_151932:3-1535(+)